MGFQGGDAGGTQIYPAAATFRLWRGEILTRERTIELEATLVEVHILPLQAEQLARSHPCV